MMVSSRKTKQSRWNSPEAEGDKEKRFFWGVFFGGGVLGGGGGREVFFFFSFSLQLLLRWPQASGRAPEPSGAEQMNGCT